MKSPSAYCVPLQIVEQLVHYRALNSLQVAELLVEALPQI